MLFDTNILIAYLNGESSVMTTLTEWKREGRPFFVSSLTISEVLSFSNLTTTDIQRIKTFVLSFIVVSFDEAIAERAASLRRHSRLLLPDAGIAATALEYNIPLVTRDKVFQKIQDLTIVTI